MVRACVRVRARAGVGVCVYTFGAGTAATQVALACSSLVWSCMRLSQHWWHVPEELVPVYRSIMLAKRVVQRHPIDRQPTVVRAFAQQRAARARVPNHTLAGVAFDGAPLSEQGTILNVHQVCVCAGINMHEHTVLM